MVRMNRILIIGATGSVGRQVLSQLPATGVRVRALARNPQTAGLPPHVDVVRGDLTVAETLDECLAGVDAAFLVWTAPRPLSPRSGADRVRTAHRIPLLSVQKRRTFFQGSQANRSRCTRKSSG
jgi:uncharacterized protein YbjT (DUF2867 family)